MSFEDAWYKRIETDLAPFVDAGTTLTMDRKGNVIEAIWSMRRRDVSARFTLSDISSISVSFMGKTLSYRAFFASEAMADIMGMAKSTVLLHKGGPYVETLATAADFFPDTQEGPATDLISKLVAARDNESVLTTFVMVTGEAGAGKTSVLKELVRRQAEKYSKGQSDFVYLYIDAQGRALARFNEALATELNDLRVQLPIYAVPPMVRLGLIVPVVDGFDELIGVGGYDDAFNSISSFVEELNGEGAIVASARSTYYEQEFLSRASRATQLGNQSWRLVSVEVQSWGDSEMREFVRLKAGADPEASDALFNRLKKIFSGENAPLAEKPLFVVRVGGYVLDGADLSGEGRLLEQLIDAFITREQEEKLLNKSGLPILTKEELTALCADLAEEMWNLGTRELDKLTVRDLADLAMSGLDHSASDKSTVIERMPSMAFLKPGEAQGSVAFEHELFLDIFLAGRLAVKIRNQNPGLSLVLSRSAMPESLAEGVAEELLKADCDFTEILEVLGAAAGQHSTKQQFAKENSGRIIGFMVASSMRTGDIFKAHFTNLIFPGSSLHGVTIRNSHFSDVEFRRIDAVDTVFDRCSADLVLFEAPLISTGTRLDISGVSVEDAFVGLRIAGDAQRDGTTAFYDPRSVYEYLKEAQFPAAQVEPFDNVRSIDPSIIRLVEKLAKAYSRCNPICAQDNYLTALFGDPSWPELEKIAISTGVIKEEVRQAHGSRRDFYRKLVQPDQLIAGLRRDSEVLAPVAAFWDELEHSFPTHG